MYSAATSGIAIQNLAIILGSSALALTFLYKDSIGNSYFQYLIFAFIIGMAVIAKLGSVTSDIAIERDWVVVLCQGDEERLAGAYL